MVKGKEFDSLHYLILSTSSLIEYSESFSNSNSTMTKKLLCENIMKFLYNDFSFSLCNARVQFRFYGSCHFIVDRYFLSIVCLKRKIMRFRSMWSKVSYVCDGVCFEIIGMLVYWICVMSPEDARSMKTSERDRGTDMKGEQLEQILIRFSLAFTNFRQFFEHVKRVRLFISIQRASWYWKFSFKWE